MSNNSKGPIKSLLESIDTAIADIYAIESSLKASDFLVPEVQTHQPGTLLVFQSNEPSATDTLEVGIAFQPHIQNTLLQLVPNNFSNWNLEDKNAFSVATEEISHFRYLTFHAGQMRSISQLELEFHGEIDKFLLLFLLGKTKSTGPDAFEQTFAQLFEHSSWIHHLPEESKERYAQATQLAREFIQKNKEFFSSDETFQSFLATLRALYRMGADEKFSLKNRF